MKTTTRYALFTLQFFLTTIAGATDVENNLQTCLDMQGKYPPYQVLECYNQIAQKQQTKAESEKYFNPLLINLKPLLVAKSPARGLSEEWSPADAPLDVYKENYISLYSHSSQPNNAPTSPNPALQVPYSYPLDRNEVKFQISVKGHLIESGRQVLWFGYTQLSFWQFYDTHHSTPFRESNYEPELIYSYRPQYWGPNIGTPAFLNAGLVHESNGEPLPRSRGWNRLYVQAGLEYNFGDKGRLSLLPRLWKVLVYSNPDLPKYLGHGDVEVRYCYGSGIYSIIKNIHSTEMDLAIPINKLFGVKIFDSNLHLQYFNGYGESLIDYNQKHHTFGLGFSLPFE